jgi:hypothetical protein
VVADIGVVEAKRIPEALRIKDVIPEDGFLMYILDDKALPFFERIGLDRMEAFWTREEHYQSK